MKLLASRLFQSCSARAYQFLALRLAFTFAALIAANPARAQISPELDKLLHRLFASSDFEVKRFGPAR